MRSIRWGNVPLPEGHLVALAIGLSLHTFRPLRLAGGSRGQRLLGSLLVSLGVALTAVAVVAARDIDVATPREVVTRGPYAFSRNPMYVGWTVIYLGVTLLADSRWLLIVLPPLLVCMRKAVLQEESMLEERFGQEYRNYRSRVRRYV